MEGGCGSPSEEHFSQVIRSTYYSYRVDSNLFDIFLTEYMPIILVSMTHNVGQSFLCSLPEFGYSIGAALFTV